MKRGVKISCKLLSLSIGAPLGNQESFRLAETFEQKRYCIWVYFLEPEDIKFLKLDAIWNFGKWTGLS